MSKIVEFTGVTQLDIDPEKVLNRALNKLEGVIVIGYEKDGEEYFASSYSDGGDILWLLERAKLKLMSVCDWKEE